MHPRAPKLLEDIRNAADFVKTATEGVALHQFTQNRMLRQAVERNFEIIGEAMRRLEKVDPRHRRPHASIPRSPRIAEPLFLARYIEKADTGTLDMISQCAQAGLLAPEFRQDGGQFIQTLWRPKGATEGAELTTAGTQSGTKSAPS